MANYAIILDDSSGSYGVRVTKSATTTTVTGGTTLSLPTIENQNGTPATGTISAATSAAPVVITSTAHGLSAGDVITVSGVNGTTAANGTWIVTAPDANTLGLTGSIANAAYTSGGSWFKLPRTKVPSVAVQAALRAILNDLAS